MNSEDDFRPILLLSSAASITSATDTTTASATATATAGGGASDATAEASIANNPPGPLFEAAELFEGTPVQCSSHMNTGDICNFETARIVFLRGAGRLEKAKAHFVLDGFVTDHVGLLEMHSKLYHHLATFEPDNKRKSAMEQRRINLLMVRCHLLLVVLCCAVLCCVVSG
jgi:hypothetical protein